MTRANITPASEMDVRESTTLVGDSFALYPHLIINSAFCHSKISLLVSIVACSRMLR